MKSFTILLGGFLFLASVSPVQAQSFDPSTDPEINPFVIRDYSSILGSFDLIDFQHPIDPKAPQLTTLIEDDPFPQIINLYQIHEIWGGPIQKPIDAPNDFASVVGFATTPGQNVLLPESGYDIGGGYQAMVLYATPDTITVNYTDSGNPAYGYTLHLENLDVDPEILTAYDQAKSEGTKLPTLSAGAVLGKAKGKELRLIIRDTGSFMDPRWKQDWWKKIKQRAKPKPLKITPLSRQQLPASRTRPLESYPEETEQQCMLWGKAPPEAAPGEVPIYTKADGRSQQEMRTNAGLNFSTGVLGSHCGQTKSQPITLREIAQFDLFELPKCKETWWMGEIQLNYGKKPEYNLKVPFAEEVNDFLLGNLTAEFASEREIEKTFSDATSYNPVTFLTSFFNVFDTVGDARRKIDQRSGVLKKLTPWGQQNILKCNFIDYVKLKGEESLYYNFRVDGRPLRSLSCPPAASGDANPLTNNLLTNQLWFMQNSRTWSKLALFPNERSPGQLKFNVCADRQYILGANYPEVFRLGLGSNQAFQTLTPSSAIAMLYRNHPYDYSDLRNPLRSGPLVDGGFYSQNVSPSPVFAQEERQEEENLLSKIIRRIVNNVVAAAQSFKTTGKRILLAQAGPGLPAQPQQITVTPELKFENNQIDYRVSIYVPVDGHISTELWIDGQKSGIGTVNAVRAGGTLIYGTPGMAPAGAEIFPVLTGNHEVKFLVKCDDCNIPGQQGQEIWASCSVTTLGGVSQTSCPLTIGLAVPQPPTCQPGVDCCAVTPACHSPSCAICSRTQKGPSDTTVWPPSYPADHVILGVNWSGMAAGTSTGPTDDPVKFTFKIPDWQPGEPLPPGCRIVNCAPDDATCLAFAYCDPQTGKCGDIVCAKEHDRTIDVYNNVPFLASAWQESASSGFSNVPGGFLNIFKPSGIKGQGLLNQCGCTANENFVFDPLGHFAPNPGASEITAGFRNSFGFYPGKQFKHPDLEVFQTSPRETDPFKITYYRLGGLCNANKWVSQKALHPKRANEPAPQCLGPGAYQPGPVLPPLKKQSRPSLPQWKRPVDDNSRCIHFLPRGTYSQTDFDIWIPKLEAMGIKWVLALYTDENQLELAAKNFAAAYGSKGIIPVWRKWLLADQLPYNYPWDRDIAILEKYGLPPYFQLYNEPGDDREWSSGSPNFYQYLDNFTQMAVRVYNAGGYVGIQVQDPEELRTLIKTLKSQTGSDDIFGRIFFVPHSYAANLPPNVTEGDIGILQFKLFADVFQQELGYVPPFIVGEGGWGYDNQLFSQYPKIDNNLHAQYYQDLFNWFNTGQLGGEAIPVPDYLFAFCPWILEAAGRTEFQGQAWFNSLDGDRTQTIEGLEKLPPFIRIFNWQKTTGP